MDKDFIQVEPILKAKTNGSVTINNLFCCTKHLHTHLIHNHYWVLLITLPTVL